MDCPTDLSYNSEQILLINQDFGHKNYPTCTIFLQKQSSLPDFVQDTGQHRDC